MLSESQAAENQTFDVDAYVDGIEDLRALSTKMDTKLAEGIIRLSLRIGGVLVGGTLVVIAVAWAVATWTDIKLVPNPPVSALLSVVLAWSAVSVVLFIRKRYRNWLGRTSRGQLGVGWAIIHLLRCQPGRFDGKELRHRRKLVKQINVLATTIEDIPANMGVRDHEVVRAAHERAQGMRALESRVAYMETEEQQRDILKSLFKTQQLFEAGKWKGLPAIPVSLIPLRVSWTYKVGWSAVAFISFCGIVAVVVLAVMGKVPQSVATFLPFVLTTFLYVALARLGISPDSMKQAVEVVSKAQGGLTGQAEGKKDEGKPEDAE